MSRIPLSIVAIVCTFTHLMLRPIQAKDAMERPSSISVLADVKSSGVKDGTRLVPLELELPAPPICTVARSLPKYTTVDESLLFKKRGEFLVPEGVKLVSLKKPVKMSDDDPIIGDAAYITDGDKSYGGGSIVEIVPGLQWVQIDLACEQEVWAIVLWHDHGDVRVYRDVVVQVSNDPAFKKDVKTLFNNDQDNSAGLGAGKDREYLESHEGKLVDGAGVSARYIRCYSKGNIADAMNHYIEVEVWGKAAK